MNSFLRLFLFSLWVLVSLPSIVLAQGGQKPWRIGTWKTAQTIQPFLYEHFNPGVKAEVLPFTNPGDQKAALLAGSLDMTGTTLVLAIQSASRGEPIVIVAGLCDKSSALVVKRDGSIKTVADLKGKRIGYVPGTMHEILLRETLTRAGINPIKDVALIRVDFFDMGTALAKGDIDAFLSGEILPSQAVHQGYGRILAHPYFDDSIGPINAAMIVHKNLIARDPALVSAMVKAHVTTTNTLMGNKSLWLEKAKTLFGIDPQVLNLASSNMALRWDLDDRFQKQVARLGARMKELGMIEREPDYATLMDTRFVRNIK